jgi:uncharacterized protein (DUF4415 family)
MAECVSSHSAVPKEKKEHYTMAIVKMTSEELREKYPFTPEVLQHLNEVCKEYEEVEADDPDSPDISELLEKNLVRRTCQGATTDQSLAQVKHDGRAKSIVHTNTIPKTDKVPITFYIEPDILASLRKKSGKNWQNRINSDVETLLRQAVSA